MLFSKNIVETLQAVYDQAKETELEFEAALLDSFLDDEI